MSIKDFAERFIHAEDEMWQHSNFSALERIESPDIVLHMPPPFPDIVGRDAHKAYLEASLAAATDIKQKWQYLTGDGNVFALSYESSSRYPNGRPDMGIPPGATLTGGYLWVLRVDGSKVTEAWLNGSYAIK